MTIQSLDYLFFLILVVVIHWTLSPKHRNLFLLLASYVFYGYVHPWFLVLLWVSTLATYGCGIAMSRRPAHKKAFLVSGLAVCLGMLGFFKYFDFFVHNIVDMLHIVGFRLSEPMIRVFLPLGISFFVFQGMSYVIDIYRGTIDARRNFIDVALFNAFFPQLAAGPIGRAPHLLPQLERPRAFLPEQAMDGVSLIIWGYFKKLVIADNVSIIANKIFLIDQPAFPVLWVGVFAFSLQIFADFSAYTDIARGAAKLMGIDLIENFNDPYLASSPVDFWRRWHISLSTWFRDYVYIPLGGSRGGTLLGVRNIMITFLLSGLWHGANWNYVLWGAYWGGLIAGYRILTGILPAGGPGKREWMPVKVFVMFILINVGWLLFRETDYHYVIRYLTLRPWEATPSEWRASGYFLCLVFLFSIPLIVRMCVDRFVDGGSMIANEPGAKSFVVRTATAAGLFLGILVLRTANSGDFFYFQF